MRATSVLIAFLCLASVFCFSGCDSSEDETTLVIASRRTFLSDGETNVVRALCLVKRLGFKEDWKESFVTDLDYEPGYEYIIKAKLTFGRTEDYPEYYKCLEVVSKTAKESSGLGNRIFFNETFKDGDPTSVYWGHGDPKWIEDEDDASEL